MWKSQEEKHSKWFQKKQLNPKEGEVKIGALIDVRDPNYVWCEAEIKMLIESPTKPALLVITYK